jgi:hypothetical protein
MRETFAEYKVRMRRIKDDQATEWQRVRDAVAAFARNGEQFDHSHFISTNYGGEPALALEDVCAVLSRPRANVRVVLPSVYTIRFTRRPAGPGDFYNNDDPAPIGNEEWSATPAIEQNEFRWDLRKGDEEEDDDEERELVILSAADLADEIAKGLAEYYLRYEAAAPQ